ncbi:hypothetical protein [Rhizocola hellebori]|nr:hypothetical protein [Rhizocola hellebori]
MGTRVAGTQNLGTPSEQAQRWAAAMVQNRSTYSSEIRTVYNSPARQELAFSNLAGATVAVLTYEKDGDLGWSLANIVECAWGAR